MLIIGGQKIRTCRACGCTDDNACVVDGVACSWVLLDIAAPTGVCSVCADEIEWQPALMVTIGMEEQPELLVAAGGLR